jgi:hypothetical protein
MGTMSHNEIALVLVLVCQPAMLLMYIIRHVADECCRAEA